jgi:hypothetical protein
VRPGLVVTVTREGRPHAEAQVELFQAQYDLGSNGTQWVAVGKEATSASGVAKFPCWAGRFVVLVTSRVGGPTLGAVQAITVGHSARSTAVTVDLLPMQRLSGRVLEAKTERPLRGARITAAAQTETSVPLAATQSDALGRFVLEVPRGEPWRLSAWAEGQQPQRRNDAGGAP